MTFPSRKLGGAFPSATRNKFCLMTGRMISGFAFTEGTGNTLTNLGLGNTLGSSWPNMGNGTIVGTANWQTDADGSPFLRLDGEYVQAYLATADTTLSRGCLVVKHTPTANGTLVHNGVALAAVKHFKILVSIIEDQASYAVAIRDTDGVLYSSASITVTAGVAHSILFSWGERGLTLAVDKYDPADSSCTFVDAAQTKPIYLVNTKYLLLQATQTGVSGQGDWYSWALFDGQPQSEREYHDLICDPELPFRPPPSRTTIAPVASPDVGRIKETSCSILHNTGRGVAGSLPSTSVGVRAYFSTDRYTVMDDASPVSASISANTDVQEPMIIEKTGLTAGTRYYYHREWTDNGSTWHPFPTGFGTFRTMPSTGASCKTASISDDHTGAYQAIQGIYPYPAEGYLPETHGFDIELFKLIPPTSVSLSSFYYSYECCLDIYNDADPVDWVIYLGDHWYHAEYVSGTGDWDADAAECVSVIKDIFYLAGLTGGNIFVNGNHDVARGDFVDKSNIAKQKIATLIWKKYNLNPTGTTYSEGGENEGIPTITSQLSWQWQLSAEHDADWRRTYVLDGGGDTAIENGSPLMNYFAFTWGDALLVFLDTHRYSFIDGATVGTLGSPQQEWFFGVLSNSDAKWKQVNAHSMVSGAVSYQWGSGIDVGILGDEEAEVHNRMRSARVTEYRQGHCHTFGLVEKDSLYYTTNLSPSSLSFVLGNNNIMALQFGTAESEGTQLYGGSAGSGTARGIVKRLYVMGYIITTWDADSYSISVRLTSASRDMPGDDVMTNTPVFSERYAGLSGLTSTSQNVTLPEIPRNVTFIIPDSELTALGSDWWTHSNLENAPDDVSPGHNYRLVDPVGDYSQEQDQSSTVIAEHASTQDGSVRVFATPMTIFTADLANSESLPSTIEFEDTIPSVIKGQTLGVIQVGIYDEFGVLLDNLLGYYCTISLQKNGESATGLSGTLTQPFVNGIATFNDLSISNVGVYKLLVTANGE